MFQDSGVKIFLERLLLYLCLVANSLLLQKQTSIYGDNNLPVKSKKGAEQEKIATKSVPQSVSSPPIPGYKRPHIPIQLRHKSEKGTTPTYWGNMLLRELLNEKNRKQSCLISWSGISVDAYSSLRKSEHKLILYNFPI